MISKDGRSLVASPRLNWFSSNSWNMRVTLMACLVKVRAHARVERSRRSPSRARRPKKAIRTDTPHNCERVAGLVLRVKLAFVIHPPDLANALRAAAHLPLLPHHRPGQHFDIQNSALCDWLCDQPAIRQWIFNVAKRHGAIQFDIETGRWRGVVTASTTPNDCQSRTNCPLKHGVFFHFRLFYNKREIEPFSLVFS
jgi:hypothetical protein